MLFAVVRLSLTQLVRPSSPARRAEAARRLARDVLLLAVSVGIAIVALMFFVDVAEIGLMPPRGTPGLWPVAHSDRLWQSGLRAVGAGSGAGCSSHLSSRDCAEPQNPGCSVLGFACSFCFSRCWCPLLGGEVIKWIVGRGRPFVGGKADAFNFVHFAGTEAYASFPSAHAITAFALAFAVSAVWPRARMAMMVYAVLIAGSRLVLLAHHPSDVVAGALVGVVGAMGVRYWFAVRRLGFAIRGDGAIVPLAPGRLKRVAREASAP